jgi:hypothetical protein
MRTIDDLTNVDDPAWPGLAAELRAAPVPIRVLPTDPERGRRCLHRLQVTARSRLGALALHTGGLLVEHGWLRVLGAGAPGRNLPDLAAANGLMGAAWSPPSLRVGFDVIGGVYEVNGADPAAMGRPGVPGEVCWFAPNELRWVHLGFGYGSWLSWIASGRTVQFYAGVRWRDWEAEVAQLPLDQILSFYPFLWSREAKGEPGRDLATASTTVRGTLRMGERPVNR